jgi:glycerol-3-phosphate dehydrogenase
MPSYKWWETPFYGIGLKMYDALAGKAGLGATEFLGRDETLALLPNARAAGLEGRRQVLGRPVQRRPAGPGAGAHRGRAGRCW